MSESTPALHPLAEWRANQVPKASQDDLGNLIGVDGMTVSRWERGESLPQKRHWLKIEETTKIARATIIAAYAREAAEAAQ